MLNLNSNSFHQEAFHRECLQDTEPRINFQESTENLSENVVSPTLAENEEFEEPDALATGPRAKSPKVETDS